MGQFLVAKAARPVRREADNMAFSQGEIERPGDVVGQPFFGEFDADREILNLGRVVQPPPDFGCAVMDRLHGTVQKSLVPRYAMREGLQVRVRHSGPPQHSRACPLRMQDLEMNGGPRDRDPGLA